MSEKNQVPKKDDQEKQQEKIQEVRLFAITEDTLAKLTEFMDMVPYGQVKELVKGIERGRWINLQVVQDEEKEAA